MLVKDMGEKRKSIKVVLTGHVMDRISERFGVENRTQITDVLSRALKDGLVSADGDGTLVEYGCLLIAGKLHDSVYEVRTVFNLCRGISERLKEQLGYEKPSPWNECSVIIPENEGGDA
jgi:hypothetical protein